MNELDSLRQEAEALKNAIRVSRLLQHSDISIRKFILSLYWIGREETGLRHYVGAGHGQYGSDRPHPNEDQEDSAWTSGQNLRHALGLGF